MRKNLLSVYILLSFQLISCSGETGNNFSEKGQGFMSVKNIPVNLSVDKEDYEGNIKTFIKRMLDEGHTPNRLINEKSPYLLQHAFNPVDWYPWGDEAFEKARKENKPIFLSIGYSTCYWCHVMEREVFEVDDIAAIMNDMFISIKVDREERPDVDRIYMQALQMMTGSGGWPMSIFMTPDLKPFWGGTYLPPESQYGRPGFIDIMTRINDLWNEDRGQLTRSADKLFEILSKRASTDKSSTQPYHIFLDAAFDIFKNSYDAQYGGFGQAPKFPRTSTFSFMFRYAERTGNESAKDMTLHTLRKISEGGIHDHLGGGFHRYSTDERWHVPHFEKMLYDQGQLIISYLEAYQLTGDDVYSSVAKEAINYVLRSMTDTNGGFYSAEDAESAPDAAHPEEKVEGAFYAWTSVDINEVLGEEDAELFSYHYNVKVDGNVLQDPHGDFENKNVLFVSHNFIETADNFGLSLKSTINRLTESRQKLFLAREERVNPHLDDKILVSWNGYMISALAKAYQIYGEETYLTAAENAANFIIDNMYDQKTKNLLRRYRDGEAGIEGNLSDYALLTAALIDLYEASFNIKWLELASELNDRTIDLFYDSKDGAFFDTPEGSQNLIVRMRDDYDGAEPTGNSIAVMNLLRLSQMLDKKELREKADKTFEYFSSTLERAPHALPQMLSAIEFSLVKPKQIIIAGEAEGDDTKKLLGRLHSMFIPNKVVLLADSRNSDNFLSDNLEIIKSMRPIGGIATAYVCENYACKLPTNDIEIFVSLLMDNSK